MNIYVRILFSIGVPVFFWFDESLPQRSPLVWSGLVIFLLLYLPIIWTHQNWWTRVKYAFVVCLAIVLTLVIHQINGVNDYDGGLLIPLILLLAKEQGEQRRFTALLAIITLMVILLITPTLTQAIMWLLIAVPLYMSIRAINIYKEAHRLSQLHLQELAETHQELRQTHVALQEANVYSMRYAALTERTHLAQEMHDGLGHQLTSLIVQLQALEMMLPDNAVQATQAVPEILDVARQAMSEVRQVVKVWQEDESGLGLIALQSLVTQCATRTHLALTFQHDNGLSDWSIEVSVALYRVLQEALTNIMRYAQATLATIEVRERDQQVTLTVADNGCYTEDKGLVPGFGLNGILKRCQALGGSCTFSQNQPHGLKLEATLPLTPPVLDDGTLKQTSPSHTNSLVFSIFTERKEHLV